MPGPVGSVCPTRRLDQDLLQEVDRFSGAAQRSSFNDKGERKGGQLIACWFESEAEGYSWLNDTVCVAEGVIDPATMSMRLRVYSLDNELIS